jgi:hypothetical protein
VWSDSKVVKSQLINRGFKKSYTIWTSHGEIDNALLEVNRGEVRDDNSNYQDGGVFDGADHGIDDDDDFDYEGLLCHIERQVYLVVLKSYVWNRAHPEGSIIEQQKRWLSVVRIT